MIMEVLLELAIFFIFYFVFMVLGITIHELGHMAFGLLTGYRFCSFRLFSLVWFKEDGKIKFKKTQYIFAGQCLMEPDYDESKFKFVRYRDYDGEAFFVEETADFDNYMVAFIVTCEAARLYDLGEYDKSAGQFNRLNIDKLPTLYKNTVKLELIYYYIVHRPDFEKAKKLYSDKKIKAMAFWTKQ